ncbi:hypothetical protein K504DRAFT_455070 [Pleomassaria siparia CBS 279.74]|uniref:Uncharacterized protein n=1 Tax=Pleomassaria siparia CBS 279.74 TaxID=1314801 RepID=A0A6G1K9W1_9PLEO|nr:hypothetical protein K504DRAFT_455070 [Pleomassaria siparia CBS 279.74]
MDIDMTDAGYDIELDVDPSIEIRAQEPQQPVQDVEAGEIDSEDAPMPAAYYESLEVLEPWPESLNLQGVSNFGPNDPSDYSLEHCPEISVKRLRWVNDNSVNIEYYSPRDAADALSVLTDPQAGDLSSISAQTSRTARGYSRKPNNVLKIRECNSGDQKAKNAAVRSQFYQKNPQARTRDRGQERERDGERRRPQRDYLDYDGMDNTGPRRRSVSYNESMYDDAPSPNDVNSNRNGRNNNRGRDGRNRDVDSYRPGAKSPRESQFGRLRDRSASPGDDGDGRLGFAEDGSSMRRRYRSRSRSQNERRRRAPSNERWTHQQSASFSNRGRGDSGGRWLKNSELPQTSREPAFYKVDMGSNHRRMDAVDDTSKGSLLSRMTKDGQPLVAPRRSLASRITRDDNEEGEESFGRLKGDNSAPRFSEFAESAPPKRDLASRMTRDDSDDDVNDSFNIRGRSQNNGFNIRGTAVPGASSFSIRGAAGGS